MDLPNIFTETVADEIIGRINKLSPDTKGQWGKMTVDQVLAHCNVPYEMVYTDKHNKPGALMKLVLKLFVKNKVVSSTPYPRSVPTAPAFIIKDRRDFEAEKARLISYIRKTQELGEAHFDGRPSHSFGPLNINEWNNMFYKHLDHHLTQFGA
jgi:hypothetical protein